jgi:hypothetical protein
MGAHSVQILLTAIAIALPEEIAKHHLTSEVLTALCPFSRMGMGG